MSFVIATFYHFFDFPHFTEARQALIAEMKRLEIKGSILIAAEGFNGTIAGTRASIDAMLAYLKENIARGPFERKESLCDAQPFGRAKVRLKKEVISLGESVNFKRKTGQYLSAREWDAVISDPQTVLIDARNSYETHLGMFEGAVDPNTRSFKELPQFVKERFDPAKHKKIATYCTGGIRCEKFSAWLLEQGFENVYQLKGGILKYLEDTPEEQSKWKGECYVFDERVAVDHKLRPSKTASMCPGCGHALTPEDRAHPSYKEDVACPYCA